MRNRPLKSPWICKSEEAITLTERALNFTLSVLVKRNSPAADVFILDKYLRYLKVPSANYNGHSLQHSHDVERQENWKKDSNSAQGMQICSFLDTLEKLRKATSFVMSVRLSFRMEQVRCQWMDFYEIWYLRIFIKSVEKIQVSLKSETNKGRIRPIYIFITSRSFPLRMRNVSDKRCRESQNVFCAQYLFF